MKYAYYNENENFAAQWLRNLIAAGHIAPGEVDERSITDVQPGDLRGFAQCHFFAGIGVWSHALRSAGWPDSRPVWTGSCPCQPFSCAGKQLGTADERHLWPAWFRLIRECRPAAVFGEQVAGPAALAWFDLVSADLEDAGYAVGAADLCAAGAGAPHIRQRLYWLANGGGHGWQGAEHEVAGEGTAGGRRRSTYEGGACLRLAHATPGGQRIDGCAPGDAGHPPQREPVGGMEHTEGEQVGISRCAREPRSAGSGVGDADRSTEATVRGVPEGPRPHSTGSFWSTADWLPCRDGKARPVEPGTFPLAHGIAGRVGRLRAYGNSLCAPVAEAFVKAAMECHA